MIFFKKETSRCRGIYEHRHKPCRQITNEDGGMHTNTFNIFTAVLVAKEIKIIMI